ncbi:hypothetical protein SAMN02745181_3882 [Rubritalea squalenifaciens DSM 18772]|uniref:P pilus assembly protein, chaperone PapD n=1 Tax=Rubritalea squalenifaciens DSM 18772 TaxID=1123071 RepID=A0A1M6SSG3_9BACT|nr:hypothetical protein [Rubritalea squalenifaciens]SHK47661.1 hypothetical protein SAMN02745181_3882 [Rubritalea squalenifaciens DSM 18772]
MRKLIILSALLLSQTVFGQLSATLKANRDQFVAFEPVNMTVNITNLSGKPLTLQNRTNQPWIEFFVRDHTGRNVLSTKDVAYSPVSIGTGQTVASTFTLNNSFNLTNPGSYSVLAVIRMPGEGDRKGTPTQSTHFTVTRGVTAWSQSVGVPGTAGDQRKYRLITFSGDKYPELYIQVEDQKRGRMLATHSLGRHITFRKFQTSLDRQNNLHVLFHTSPSVACHTVINPAGRTIERTYHKNSATGVPRLLPTTSGNVSVVNSIPYDPQKEAEEKAKFHNISEIPGGVQQ